MNTASQQRLERAKAFTQVYASHPAVRAIIVGGSVARGTAHEGSDIDLGIFWARIASTDERNDLIQKIGGKLHRRVDNAIRYSDDNPRRRGCIEIVTIEPLASMQPLAVDLEHETVAGTERVLAQVLDELDPCLEKHELLSVIQDGIALYGHELVARWREKAGRYPQALALKTVEGNLRGIGRTLLHSVHWAEDEDWLCLYESFLSAARRLLLALMALNRRWAFTDNPDFGGFGPVVEEFALKPERFVQRVGQSLQSPALQALRGFAMLHGETLELVEAHLPAVDTSGEREALRQIDARIDPVR
jgi:predicted nucleotidyltransferase